MILSITKPKEKVQVAQEILLHVPNKINGKRNGFWGVGVQALDKLKEICKKLMTALHNKRISEGMRRNRLKV